MKVKELIALLNIGLKQAGNREVYLVTPYKEGFHNFKVTEVTIDEDEEISEKRICIEGLK